MNTDLRTFSQHDMNMHQAVSNGYGIALELNTINTEQILTAINTVLADKRLIF